MEAPGLNQETVHGNRGLQGFLADSLQYSRNLSTGYIVGDKWYVNGDVAGTGDGTTWDKAFKTFAEAVAAIGDDDVIFLAPGSYNEGVTHTITEDNVKIIGVGSGRGVATEPTLASYVSGSDEGDEDILYLEGDNIEVSGIRFLMGNGYWGIRAGETTNATNLWVHDCYFYSGAQGGGKGVEMGRRDGTNGNAISFLTENNTFFKCGTGINLDGSRAQVKNNTFLAYGQTSVQITCPQSGSQRNSNVITDNKFIVLRANDGEKGIYFSGASSPTDGTMLVDGNQFINFGSATLACNKLATYGGRNFLGDQFLTDANPPVATTYS